MLSPAEFHELISGHRRGKRAALWRMGLRAAEIPYTWAVRYRNFRYDRGQAETHRLDVPVISVGNLTLGGTGKTPMIAWLARQYCKRDLKVGIVSRGYGSVDGQPNDEARELAKLLPDVPHVQDRDRVAGARRLLQEHDADVMLLDDGFQHRRLHRDLDVVLIDALQPNGFGHVFPRGTLREPLEGLKRAGIAILTRSDMISAAERQAIRESMQALAPEVTWAEASHRATGLVDHAGTRTDIRELTGQRVFAFCGIGNPTGFFDSLAKHGCEIVGRCVFADHCSYRAADIRQLAAEISDASADHIVCTQKDLVKIPQSDLGGIRLSALQIEMEITRGGEELDAALRQNVEHIKKLQWRY